MTPDQKQKVLAMARHEFGLHSACQLQAEYERKKALKELYIFDHTLTEGEMLALFETLIEEKRCERCF